MTGRKDERKIFQKLQRSKNSEFIAVVGRRRVGKTYLIEEYFKPSMTFHISGQKDFTNKQHLGIFSGELKKRFPKIKLPQKNSNWINAISNLIYCIEQTPNTTDQKQTIFFDELPWLSKPRSQFLAALGYFWNEWARKNNIILIVCGSAASWMLKNIVREKGSLYNRMTQLINVQPFTLQETKAFLEAKDIRLTNEQLIQIYIAMGGIPHYLKEIEQGKTATQNIDQICFSPNGLLNNEYGNLYDALFTNSHEYKAIIEALYATKRGLTKLEIAAVTKLIPNGAFYNKVEELTECGFIIEMQDLTNKSKQNVYRLIDEYSLFYHQFIKGKKNLPEGYWYNIANTAQYHTWSGYAFENVCIRHINKIKTALQIGGMQTKVSSFYKKGNNDIPGAQVDILIDRADNCINLIECKYYKDDFYLDKKEAEKIKSRKAIFKHHSKTKKQIFVTIISPSKLMWSKDSIGLVDQALEGGVLID